MRKALAWEKVGKLGEALQTLEQVLAAQPRHGVARLRRGLLVARSNRFEEALQDWTQALTDVPALLVDLDGSDWRGWVDFALQQFNVKANDEGNAEAYLRLARACSTFGRYEQALLAALKVMRLRPHDPPEEFLDQLFARLGYSEYAVDILQRICEAHPDQAFLHYRLGVVQQRVNSTALAVRCFERALEIDKDHWQSRLALGNIWLGQGRTEAAYQEFVASLRSRRDSVAALLGLADCCRKLFRFEEGLQYCRRANSLSPGDPAILAGLGALHLQLGQLKEGLQCLTESLQLDANQPGLYLDAARTAQQLGDDGRAAHYYALALQHNPNDDVTAYQAGLVQHRLGKLPEARNSFLAAFKASPQTAEYAQACGLVMLDLNQAQEAVNLLNTALGLQPDHPELLLLLGRARLEAGAYAEAVRACSRAMAVSSDHPEAGAVLGQALAGLGNLEEAEQRLRAALQAHPRSAQVHLGLGRLAWAAGNPREAVEAYLKALESGPALRPVISELSRLAQASEHRARIIAALTEWLERCAGEPGLAGPGLRHWLELLGRVPDYELGALIADRLIKACPEHENVRSLHGRWHFGWARRLKESGDNDGAAQSLRRLLEGQPDHAEGATLLSTLELGGVAVLPLASPVRPSERRRAETSGGDDPALPSVLQCRQAVERLSEHDAGSPDLIEIFTRTVKALREAGQLRTATITFVRECLGRDPANEALIVEAHNLFRTLVEDEQRSGRPRQALSAAAAWLTLFPDLTEAAQTRQRLLDDNPDLPMMTGESEGDEANQALADLFDRAGREPDDEPTRRTIFEALANDDTRLIRFYNDLAYENPEDARHALNLARAYVHVGSDSLAVHQYRRSVKLRPLAQAYVELAETYQRLGKPELAASALKKAQQ